MNILLLEDDPTIVFGLRKFLESCGYTITAVLSVQEAKRILDQTFDLFILDIGLPDGTGFEVCELIRKKSIAPIIFLTAHDDEKSLLKGFDLGGDDYITKPFRLEELKRRILAITNRIKPGVFETYPLSININTATVKVFDVEVVLSVLEYKMLLALYKNRDTILSRDALALAIWENTEFITDNALSVTMKRLREKLGNSIEIKTIHGRGYQLKL